MPKTYKISKEEGIKVKEILKGIKDKRVDKRLQAVQLRGEGMKNSEMKKLDTTRQTVSLWVSTYVNGGV